MSEAGFGIAAMELTVAEVFFGIIWLKSIKSRARLEAALDQHRDAVSPACLMTPEQQQCPPLLLFAGKCKAPSGWDPKLRFSPEKKVYALNEVVQLSCVEEFVPSTPEIQCISREGHKQWNETATCKEGCQQPQWDSQIRFSPNQRFYGVSEEVTLSCFMNDTPPLAMIRCANRTSPKLKDDWEMLDTRGTWHRLAENLTCTMAKCPKPQWDARLQFSENKTEYPQNRELTMTCPEGLEPSFPEVKCTKDFQGVSSGKPIYVDVWWGRNSTGAWTHMEKDILCMEGCRRPPWNSRLQLAPDQEVYKKDEKVKLSCPGGFQPSFTEIKCQSEWQCNDSVTAVYKRLWCGRNSRGVWVPIQSSVECIVPGKLEELWLDPDRGSLRWNSLPSCNGEIIGYQLSITARNAVDSSVLETERLRLNGSVTEHRLPEHGAGGSYAVTIRGLTAAGAGGRVDEGVSHQQLREHQLIVATTHNGSVIESICSGRTQLFNASTYLAAVLNLTGPTDFVLGDGSRGQGQHNAALRPGCDYTALLLLVRLSPQAEKFTCVCYSFSVGQEPSSLLDRKLVVMALALTVAFLALGILLLFVVFRLKNNGSKASENNSTIPLRGCQKDTCKPNTQILVEELLEALKMFKREEIEAEQTDDESVDRHSAGLLREYQQLSSTLLHPCNAGKELCNQNKNRYKSIIPYDHCRVVLQPSDTGNGYINASYMDTYRSPRFFIAAQGPLAGTVVDFWHMVWQEKTSVIVMLTGLMEQNKIKCEQYWPEQEQVYGDFTVTLNNTWTTTGLVKRIFCLQKAGCALPRAVEQFHYLLWPDHGVPKNPSQLLCLVEVVNKRVLEAPAGPVLVHCSAGIGRTGTFIALDFLLKMGKAEGKVDVFHCVQQLREQRVSMVQTKEQYSFLYEALLEGLLCGNTGVPVESIATLVHSFERQDLRPQQRPREGVQDGSPAYINAVFASTYTEEERIIITQLPFPTTLVDFWALVWDYTCTSVVVLNQLKELDKTYVQFWPTQGEDDYGRFHVQLISEEPGAGFTTWTLVLSNRQQEQYGLCYELALGYLNSFETYGNFK
ncbi:hypothetical protein DUI87_06473 [Hirundo rustica rustica]|uniref:protein-tyrosine-phosphatase n=1 Tax=Hirundo rustica rustica TaxID=333673 RepID=A0A3M0KUC8_HIRRU|nr:hypothetical protein DUI87_06473 [Hirundo rustica rustica]